MQKSPEGAQCQLWSAMQAMGSDDADQSVVVNPGHQIMQINRQQSYSSPLHTSDRESSSQKVI
jgi:hypothetical protein